MGSCRQFLSVLTQDSLKSEPFCLGECTVRSERRRGARVVRV